MKSNAVAAYGGLTRTFVQTTLDCTSPERDLISAIDLDGVRAPTGVVVNQAACDIAPIVVAASANGLGEATISIPTSVDAAADGVLAVAARTSHSFSYLDDFVG